jgi:hypothetical protein
MFVLPLPVSQLLSLFIGSQTTDDRYVAKVNLLRLFLFGVYSRTVKVKQSFSVHHT